MKTNNVNLLNIRKAGNNVLRRQCQKTETMSHNKGIPNLFRFKNIVGKKYPINLFYSTFDSSE